MPAASFLTWPGAQPFLPLSSCDVPAALPPVPTVLPVLSPSADEAPVPTLEAEFASPEPAAEPPVPTELLEVPPPADEPPVPSVEAEPEPEPEPAAEPPVPTVLLEVPPPADEPPVPIVEDEPELQLVAPAGQVPPAELPPVPTVLLAVPPPADEPPVPTVLDDCAKPETAVPARNAAAKARWVSFIMMYPPFVFERLSHPERMNSCLTNFGSAPLFLP